MLKGNFNFYREYIDSILYCFHFDELCIIIFSYSSILYILHKIRVAGLQNYYSFVTISLIYCSFHCIICDILYSQLRARRALLQLKDVPLRTRRALLLYKVNGNSALLVLNGTSLICNSALLALS